MSQSTPEIVAHTPGPWTVTRVTFDANGTGDFPYGVSAQPMGQPVPVVIVSGVAGTSDTMRAANARLIATAPDLLQLAKRVAEAHGPWSAWANDLIVKAEGRWS